jgi:hypothetical protein
MRGYSDSHSLSATGSYGAASPRLGSVDTTRIQSSAGP